MKKVKITTIILAIILVTLVAFAGVYIKTQNRMENKVKDYSFGRELKGERIVELKVANQKSESAKLENYEIVKKTLEKRLNNLKTPDYTISLNKEDGTIIVELPEDNNTDTYVYYLTASGKVQVVEDGENGVELLNDSMVEKALYTYTSDIEGAYQVFLDVYLTEEGKAKIQEIKNNYAVLSDEIKEIEAAQSAAEKENTTEGENTTTEESATKETSTEVTKKIARLKIGETEYDISTIEDNKVRVIIGAKTANTTYVNSYISVAVEASMLINSGKFPIEYQLGENRFVYSDITNTNIIYFAVAIAIILVIVFIIFVIKYKISGLLASISYIGFVSLLALILRYTNVSISIEGIGAIILVLIINIRINQMILNINKEKSNVNEAIINTYKELFLKLVPIIIITLTFCFAGVSNLISFGMIMFWGLLLIAVYNAIVTKTLLKLRENK
ncbi:MAG: hypothetical protein IJE68_05705 [Clostridia bacterium]|nr:hypothetical protein [Clostridia bacterium]